MSRPGSLDGRPPAREAGPELLVLARWEELCGWLFQHTGRWPRSVRYSLTRRVQDAALEVAEILVVARYEPEDRARLLRRANLTLERMRLLLRLARATGTQSARVRDLGSGRLVREPVQRVPAVRFEVRAPGSRSAPRSWHRGPKASPSWGGASIGAWCDCAPRTCGA